MQWHRIFVSCGSSIGRRAVYRDAAEQFGTLLVERGIELVYGGNIGLMGVLADAVLSYGGP
jgi:predicted Rossmann-fold nucleotide-binding protein